MTYLQHLRELAQKATPRDGKWFTEDRIGYHGALTMKSERDFIAACSPDRILALLDIADAAARILEHGPNGCDAIECFHDALARLRGAK